MKRRPTKAARAKLSEDILAALRRRPYTIRELAEAFGFSTHAVGVRLHLLLESGSAHYFEVPSSPNLNAAHVWRIGPADPELVKRLASVKLARRARRDSDSIEVPRRSTARQYPVVGRRDPLVAALFGPVHPELA